MHIIVCGGVYCNDLLIFLTCILISENHTVGIISQAYFLSLAEFGMSTLEDKLIASKDYILSALREKFGL